MSKCFSNIAIYLVIYLSIYLKFTLYFKNIYWNKYFRLQIKNVYFMESLKLTKLLKTLQVYL